MNFNLHLLLEENPVIFLIKMWFEKNKNKKTLGGDFLKQFKIFSKQVFWGNFYCQPCLLDRPESISYHIHINFEPPVQLLTKGFL